MSLHISDWSDVSDLARDMPNAYAKRGLQADGGMASLYDDDGCQCTDPKKSNAATSEGNSAATGGVCYEPVCAEGYFKCCFNCEVSLCAEGDKKNNALVLSKRGVFECLQCTTGDFCEFFDVGVED